MGRYALIISACTPYRSPPAFPPPMSPQLWMKTSNLLRPPEGSIRKRSRFDCTVSMPRVSASMPPMNAIANRPFVAFASRQFGCGGSAGSRLTAAARESTSAVSSFRAFSDPPDFELASQG